MEEIKKEEVMVSEETTVNTATEVTEDELHGENLNERAKVLSPLMTVMKRFFRSKLSMVGLVTLIILFVFSFIGPLFSPWRANEGSVIDTKPENIKSSYNIKSFIHYNYDSNLICSNSFT